WATANAAKYLFPGNPDRAVAIQLIEPAVQLVTLCVRQWDGLRRRGETVPELLQEAQAFFGAEVGNVYRPHGISIRALRKWGDSKGVTNNSPSTISRRLPSSGMTRRSACVNLMLIVIGAL